MRQHFILAHAEARRRAVLAVQEAPDGYAVVIGEPTRNLEQNAKFHALCHDVARSGVEWMGKTRTAAQWKVLFVSGHAIATGIGADVVPGLEGEFVNIRESTASMSKKRGSSLIEYVLAWCAENDILLPSHEGEGYAKNIPEELRRAGIRQVDRA